MKKRLLSLGLALLMAVSLVTPTMAAESTFVDVPEKYWGFADIEAAAEKGYMVGVSADHFDPEGTVNVAQFLTLLGRMVFPEVSTEGSTWYGPYVAKMQEQGLLNGSLVDTNDVWAGISRYDMAVILRAAAKKLGIAEKMAQQSEVNDYLDIPARYTEAVLAVYGMGLITGDNKHNFNGSATMRRAEVAVVIMRLDRAMPTGGNTGTTTNPTESANPTTTPQPTESEEPAEFVPPTVVDMPTGEKMVEHTVSVALCKKDRAMGRPADDKSTYLPDVPFKIYYTPDNGKTCILVAEATTHSRQEGEWRYSLLENSVNVTFMAPESWGNLPGLFVSAETTYNGEKLVTSDLRTDGRAHISEWSSTVELTPLDGAKAKFTFQGHVVSHISGHSGELLPGFAIQLYLADGRLVGETVSEADGSFSMACEVDAMDGGFDLRETKYYYTASGYIDGVKYEDTGRNNAGNLILWELYRLNVCDALGKSPLNPNYELGIFPSRRKDA